MWGCDVGRADVRTTEGGAEEGDCAAAAVWTSRRCAGPLERPTPPVWVSLGSDKRTTCGVSRTAGDSEQQQRFSRCEYAPPPEPPRSRARRVSTGASRAGHDEPAPSDGRRRHGRGPVLVREGDGLRPAVFRDSLRLPFPRRVHSPAFVAEPAREHPITSFMGVPAPPPASLHSVRSSTNL